MIAGIPPQKGEPSICVAYGLFVVHDVEEQQCAVNWTDAHSQQGFARLPSAVSFAALVPDGMASVIVTHDLHGYLFAFERVIAVPFVATSGSVYVGGPEGRVEDRSWAIEPGHYRLYCAQRLLDDEDLDEEIVLVFEHVDRPETRSRIFVADARLNPPKVLCEDATPLRDLKHGE